MRLVCRILTKPISSRPHSGSYTTTITHYCSTNYPLLTLWLVYRYQTKHDQAIYSLWANFVTFCQAARQSPYSHDMRMLSFREEVKEEDATSATDLSVPNDYTKGPLPRRLDVFVSLASGHSLAPLPQPLPKEMRREVVLPKRETPRTITLVTSTVPTIPYRQPPPPPAGPRVAVPARPAYPTPVPAYPSHVYGNRDNDMRYYGEYLDPYGQNYDLSPTSVAAPEIALFNPVPSAPLCGHNYDLSPLSNTTISASFSFDEECAILGISCCIYIYMV